MAVIHDGALLVSDDAKARSFGLPAGLVLNHALCCAIGLMSTTVKADDHAVQEQARLKRLATLEAAVREKRSQGLPG